MRLIFQIHNVCAVYFYQPHSGRLSFDLRLKNVFVFDIFLLFACICSKADCTYISDHKFKTYALYISNSLCFRCVFHQTHPGRHSFDHRLKQGQRSHRCELLTGRSMPWRWTSHSRQRPQLASQAPGSAVAWLGYSCVSLSRARLSDTLCVLLCKWVCVCVCVR